MHCKYDLKMQTHGVKNDIGEICNFLHNTIYMTDGVCYRRGKSSFSEFVGGDNNVELLNNLSFSCN